MGLNQNHILSMQTCPKLEVPLYGRQYVCSGLCLCCVSVCSCLYEVVCVHRDVFSVVGERKNHQENGVGIKLGKAQVFM